DVDLIHPVVGQLLASYYRGGILRYFVLQCVPSLIYIYLLALAKRQKKSVSVIETFFLALYNEEILAGGLGSDTSTKKVEEVRIPSVRYPSIYHDPRKMNITPDVPQLKPGAPAFVQVKVRIGPFSSIERITAENRQTVLTRVLKAVNGCLSRLSRGVVCPSLCLSTIALCQSGFPHIESDFRSRVFQNDLPHEIIEDFSKKPRIRLSSQFLLESMNGVYFALFNGAADLAVRAIDSVHHRAIYELYSDVLLVTNSVRNSLLESSYLKSEEMQTMRRAQLNLIDKRHVNENMVTNASLKVHKMPEDITIISDESHQEEKPSRKTSFTDGVEGIRKKISMRLDYHKSGGHIASHHYLSNPQRKAGNNTNDKQRANYCNGSRQSVDLELETISEEAKITDSVINMLASESIDDSIKGGKLYMTGNDRAVESDLRQPLLSTPSTCAAIPSPPTSKPPSSTLLQNHTSSTAVIKPASSLIQNFRHVDSFGDSFESSS
ncbi:hypothetical protein AB6A40_006852, partial [Gnathostoma spinigerum]